MANHRYSLISLANLYNGIQSDFLSKGDSTRDVIDRAARHANGAQHAEPFVGGFCAQPFDQQWAQGIAVAVAVFGVGKSGIARQIEQVEDFTELAELPVVSGCDNQVLVCGRQWFVGVQAGMGVTHAMRNDATRDICRGLIDHS